MVSPLARTSRVDGCGILGRSAHKEGPMPLRRWSPAITLIVTGFALSSVMPAPAWGSSERLAAIPIPATLRPHLSAACQAWGRHVGELIEQHRSAHELTDEE